MTAVMIDVWVNTSFCMLLVLAGLQSLPKSPFESAKIDGGSTMFNFRNLTLPMLKPSLYIALLFRLMAALQEYAVIFALTKGGPGDTLMNLSLTAYQTGFQFQKFGYALPYILVLWVFINIIAKQIVKRQRSCTETGSRSGRITGYWKTRLFSHRKDVKHEYSFKKIRPYSSEWTFSHIFNICSVSADLDADPDI